MGKPVLKVGAAVADITPALEVGLLTSAVKGLWAPFQSVRSRLKARVLVLEFGGEHVAVVSLDMLALSDAAMGGWAEFKTDLAGRTSHLFSADRIILNCTHTHTAPESGAITDLYRTEPFRQWLDQLKPAVAAGIVEAAGRKTPSTVAIGCENLHGYSLQRRIPTSAGIIMSDSVQPIAPELMVRGPVDHRVRVLFFRSLSSAGIATVVQASCHPVHEMCIPKISADFPGELCQALEADPLCGVPIFFNGAAGDINPPTVSEGAEAARRHGVAMAGAVASSANNCQPVEVGTFSVRSRSFSLPTRAVGGVKEPCVARFNAIRLGGLAVLFMPGELFTNIALSIEKDSPFQQTIVVGFSENSIGYVPTVQAFREGGYEIGPGKWSFLSEEAELLIRAEAGKLLRDLMEDGAEPRVPLLAEREPGGARSPQRASFLAEVQSTKP